MEKQVSIGISKIKELEFSILSNQNPTKELGVGLGVLSNYNIEKDTFEIRITYDLLNPDSGEKVVHILVANEFFIQNMKEFLAEEGKALNIPDSVLVTMLSLSISHTRAYLAKNTSGTVYENYYVPIVNPTEIAQQVFKIE